MTLRIATSFADARGPMNAQSVLDEASARKCDVFKRSTGRTQFREIENVIENFQQIVSGGMDGKHGTPVFGIHVGFQQRRRKPEDGVHRCPNSRDSSWPGMSIWQRWPLRLPGSGIPAFATSGLPSSAHTSTTSALIEDMMPRNTAMPRQVRKALSSVWATADEHGIVGKHPRRTKHFGLIAGSNLAKAAPGGQCPLGSARGGLPNVSECGKCARTVPSSRTSEMCGVESTEVEPKKFSMYCKDMAPSRSPMNLPSGSVSRRAT